MSRKKGGEGPTAGLPGRRWRAQWDEEHGQASVGNRGVFDELVIDDWFHLEQMDKRRWWMRIGGNVIVNVHIDERGRATVTVEKDG